MGKEVIRIEFIEKTGKVVGLNVAGDGVNQNSAQLQVRFQEKSKAPVTLLVTAGAAPQFFQAVCSVALYAYEESCDVTVKIADGCKLVYMQLRNLD